MIRAGLAGAPDQVDVVVVGLGATGTGAALDAASRGLSVLAVDGHDLAFGTSRWSSKLVHGGLRYLASGQVAVAHESAVERGVLMQHTAPHLTRAGAMLVPLLPQVTPADAALTRAGLVGGDLLRRWARTSSRTLPRPRRLSTTETLALAPGLRSDGLRGGLLSWDGRLEDDARLVVALARTAAVHGATMRTRARAISLEAGGVVLRDETTGAEHRVASRAVVNATGVWAGGLADVHLRPSRGTHLVLRSSAIPGHGACLLLPIPGARARFVLVLPQPDGLTYVGLTDEPADGPVPDVPQPTEAEIDFLLGVVGGALARPVTRADVVGAYAGLRPLLDTEHLGASPSGGTADLSRRHAVLIDPGKPVVTVVGGKLTTYRRMAEDAVDAAVRVTGLTAGPCRTTRIPLLGAASRVELARLAAGDLPPRLVRRYGAEAALVLESARATSGLDDATLLAPVAPGVPTCLAELLFGATHEGAHDVADLLERRTRVGLVAPDREAARPAAEHALALAAASDESGARPRSGSAAD